MRNLFYEFMGPIAADMGIGKAFVNPECYNRSRAL